MKTLEGQDPARHEEQSLLGRLNVFHRSFTRDAAITVCRDSGFSRREIGTCIDALVAEGRLMPSGGDGNGRFRFADRVQDRHREFSDPESYSKGIHSRHYRWFLKLLKDAANDLHGPSQDCVLRNLHRDRSNIDAAIRWSLRKGARQDEGLQLIAAAFWYWYKKGLYADGIGWCNISLARKAPVMLISRMRALNVLGMLQTAAGDLEQGRESLLQALDLAKALTERQAEAAIRSNLGDIFRSTGNLAAARLEIEESVSIYRATHQPAKLARSLTNLGSLLVLQGDPRAGIAVLNEARSKARSLKDKWLLASISINLGEAKFRQNRLKQAEALVAAGVEAFRQIGEFKGASNGLRLLAGIACGTGEYSRAVELMAAAERARDVCGLDILPCELAENLDWVAEARSALGEAEYEEAWAMGYGYQLDEAISLAIGRGA